MLVSSVMSGGLADWSCSEMLCEEPVAGGRSAKSGCEGAAVSNMLLLSFLKAVGEILLL